MKTFFKLYALFALSLMPWLTQAQCAMCRTQLVNNVSHGDTSLAAGLNFGIMYLFITPYLAIGVVAYFWFKKSKINERKKGIASRFNG